ncbi:MAG: chemotaxis protein CheW [Chitinispirillaceae bacterium]|nr:chemotaxis protein CheW [Chitinispirillaceae bacterium]
MRYQFVTFTIGEYLLGINVVLVREINQQTNLTFVDLAPDFVRGLMNLRGQIVTIIDPGIRLGIIEREFSEKSKCLVLKTAYELEEREETKKFINETVNEPVGLLVDSICEMVTANSEEIEKPPANIGEIDSTFMKGILKLENRLMIEINTGELLKR